MRPYSRIASAGVTFTVERPGSASLTVPPAGGAPRSGAMRSCAFTSQTSTRLPARTASRASAADTVDFPTPPFPVTISSRRSRRGEEATRLDKLTRAGGQVHHALRRPREEQSAAQEGARGGRGAGREGDRDPPRERRALRRAAGPRLRGGAREGDAREGRRAGAPRREPAVEGRRRGAAAEARGARGAARRPHRQGGRARPRRRGRSGLRRALGMRRIAFINEKGGTCKTTLCVNVAARLAARGLKVLVADLDTQGHAGKSLGVDVRGLSPTIHDWLVDAAVRLD